MAYLVFARKYRPQTFSQVVKQEHVTRTLQNAIEAGRLAHAILFAGPRGTGKTTIARILAKAVNCSQGPASEPCNQCRSCREITAGGGADVFEIDGASNNSVDQVRDLRENLQYMPAHSRFKIYIIDEVHMLSTAAFNALLKTLEEPPAHVMFMFATTEPHKIPITILSRCQRHDLLRIATQAIFDHLAWICRQEKVELDEKTLRDIARCADGSMRDALSLLDQVVACAGDSQSLADVTRMLVMSDAGKVYEMAGAILENDISKALRLLADVYSHGDDLHRFYLELASVFRHLNVLRLGKQARSLVDLPEDDINELEKLAVAADQARLELIFDTLVRSEAMVKLALQPRLAFEMILVRLSRSPTVLSIETLIDKIDQVRKSFSGGGAGPLDEGPQGEQEQAAALPESDCTSTAGGQDLAGQTSLVNIWKSVARQVGQQKPSLGVILEKSVPVVLQGKELTVEMRGNGFAVKAVEKNKALVEKAAAGVLGRPVRLRMKADVEPAEAKKKQKAALQRCKQEALAHPLVADALEIFNAKIYDVRVKQDNTGGNNP